MLSRRGNDTRPKALDFRLRTSSGTGLGRGLELRLRRSESFTSSFLAISEVDTNGRDQSEDRNILIDLVAVIRGLVIGVFPEFGSRIRIPRRSRLSGRKSIDLPRQQAGWPKAAAGLHAVQGASPGRGKV